MERSRFNPKRRLWEREFPPDERDGLAERVRYTGNPHHKRNPGDFGLTPPGAPRPNKTLCDGALIFQREIAQSLLEDGIKHGLVSERWSPNGYPQNVWAVTGDGIPVEAQLENRDTGEYHGYPLPESDPLHEQVLAW